MSDKTLTFNIAVEGVSNEERELERLGVQIKNLKKETQELEKAAKKGIASDTQLRQLAAYRAETYKQTEQFKKLKQELYPVESGFKKYHNALLDAIKQLPVVGNIVNNFTSNIDNSTHSVDNSTTAVDNFGKNAKAAGIFITALSGIVGGAVLVFNKLKDAFLATEKGLKYFNVAAEVTKQIFYDLLKTRNLNYDNIVKVAEAAVKLNNIRIGDRKDLIEFAKLEREISILEFEAADKTKTRAERQESLNKAIQKQNELSDKKIADAKEELFVVNELLEIRPDDTKLLDKQSQLIAKIYDLDRERYEQSKRNESRMTGFIQEGNEELKKRISFSQSAIDEWIKMNALLEKGTDEYIRMQDEIAKVIIAEAELAAQRKFSQQEIEDSVKYKAPDGSIKNTEIEALAATNAEKDRIWNEGLQKAREAFEANKELQQEAANESIEIDLAKLDSKQAIADAEIAVTAGLSEAIAQLSGKNKALSLTALAIEKAAAIAQIIANISIANAKAIATSPLTFGQPWVSLNTGLGAISIGNLIAQAANSANQISGFNEGGKIKGGLQIHNDTSKDNTLIYVKQGETVLNTSQVSRLGGSGAMRKARVPGYAMGGYVGQQAPEIPASGFDYEKLARLIPTQIVLDINKVNSAQRQLQIVTEPQRI